MHASYHNFLSLFYVTQLNKVVLIESETFLYNTSPLKVEEPSTPTFLKIPLFIVEDATYQPVSCIRLQLLFIAHIDFKNRRNFI